MSDPLAAELSAVEEGFCVLDEALSMLEARAIESDLAMFEGTVLLNGKNLAVGCCSLLDGLGQEAGALFRPLLEVLDASVYLRTIPNALDEARNGTLPRSGLISRAVSDKFKALKDSLSETASHFGFSMTAMRHLISVTEREGAKWRLMQQPNVSVACTNLVVLGWTLYLLVHEALLCVEAVCGCPPEIIEHAERFRGAIQKHHSLVRRPGGSSGK